MSFGLDNVRPSLVHSAVGVRFVPTRRPLFAVTDTAVINFRINLPKFPTLLPLDPPIISCAGSDDVPGLTGLCHKTTEDLRSTITSYNQRLSILKDKEQELQKLLKPLELKTSRKRALIGAGGTALNWLFGVATEEQVSNLMAHIHLLQKNAATASSERQTILDTVSDSLNITEQRINGIWHSIDSTAEVLSSVSVSLNNITRRINYLQQHSDLWMQVNINSIEHSALLVKILELDTAIGTITEFISSLPILLRGQLPEKLVNPTMLNEGLLKLSKYVQTLPVKLYILNDTEHLQYYYSSYMAAAIFHDSVLYISFQTPLLSNPLPFDVYRIVITPLHLHNGNSKGFSILEDVLEYFALSRNELFYKSLTRAQYQQCSHDFNGFCPDLSIVRYKHKPSCISAIFFQQDNDVTLLCKFKIFTSTLKHDLQKLASNTYLLWDDKDEIQITCPDHKEVIKVSTFSLIDLPCGCYIDTGNFVSDPDISACGLQGKVINVSHPINFPLLAAFNFSRYMTYPKTILSSKYPVVLPAAVPELVDKISRDERVDQRLGYEVTKLANRLMQNDASYISDSLAEPVMSWNDWHVSNITLLSVLGLCQVLEILLIFWLIYKYRILMAAFALHFNGAVSFSLPPPVVSTTKPFVTESDLDLMVKIVFLGTLIFFVLTKLSGFYKYIGNRFGTSANDSQYLYVHLKCSDSYDQCMVPLMTVPFETDMAIISGFPSLHGAIVSNSTCWPVLNLRWNSVMEIRRPSLTRIYTMPTTIPISILQKGRFEKILQSSQLQFALMYRFNTTSIFQSHSCYFHTEGHYINLAYAEASAPLPEPMFSLSSPSDKVVNSHEFNEFSNNSCDNYALP